MVLLTDKDRVLEKFTPNKSRSGILRKAQTLANAHQKEILIAEVRKKIVPKRKNYLGKIFDKYYELTGLDKQTMFELKGNHPEKVTKRAWASFILMNIGGYTRKYIAKRYNLKYNSMITYEKRIRELVKQPPWVRAKWEPLIRIINKYHPEVWN